MTPGGAPLIHRFENCVLDIDRRELQRAGVVQLIEPQVFDLLQYLIENRDRVVSRDEIFSTIWNGRIVSDAALSTRINAVRRAIGDTGSAQRLVRTYRRKGIRFVGTVREEKAKAEIARSVISPKQRFAFELKGVPGITVLPFVNIGGDIRGKYFADGLTEELITSLSKLGWFYVISRHSLLGPQGNSVELKQAARKLGVRYVLQGSVRRVDSRSIIAVQLVDAISNHNIWVDRYDRDHANALGVQEDITEKVVSTIGDQIYAAENIRVRLKSSENFSAWEYSVKALSIMHTLKWRQFGVAQKLLKKAVAIDPKSAPAYSLLSFLNTLGVHQGWYSRHRALSGAFHNANKALALDHDDPWAHLALGYATIWQRPEEAIPILEYALELNPNIAIAHYMIALASTYSGKCDDVSGHAELAGRLGSRDLLTQSNPGGHINVRATACFVMGRHREGMEYAREAVKASPGRTTAYRSLAVNCALGGEIEEAKSVVKTLKRLAPDISQRWISESTVWANNFDKSRYAEAFRMAGLK